MTSTTASKQVLEAFEAERASFFTMSLDLLVIAGLDGYFKLVNPAWETTLGFTPEEMVSRPFVGLHPPGRHRANERALRLTG